MSTNILTPVMRCRQCKRTFGQRPYEEVHTKNGDTFYLHKGGCPAPPYQIPTKRSC